MRTPSQNHNRKQNHLNIQNNTLHVVLSVSIISRHSQSRNNLPRTFPQKKHNNPLDKSDFLLYNTKKWYTKMRFSQNAVWIERIEERMDIQLQELIEKIKKDGIETATEDADHIKQEAQAEAKNIVDAAKKEAATLAANAKADADRAEKAAKAAVAQASRNLVLSFKDEIQALLDKIIARRVADNYTDDVLKTVIPSVVAGWVAGKGPIDVILDDKQLTSLKDWAASSLAGEIAKGVELKAGRNVGAGFRIAEKDGSAYYDFSAEAVTDALCDYLNPALADLLKSNPKITPKDPPKGSNKDAKKDAPKDAPKSAPSGKKKGN
jgi:V/A-type H+-transporting ATPase subunit E